MSLDDSMRWRTCGDCAREVLTTDIRPVFSCGLCASRNHRLFELVRVAPGGAEWPYYEKD